MIGLIIDKLVINAAEADRCTVVFVFVAAVCTNNAVDYVVYEVDLNHVTADRDVGRRIAVSFDLAGERVGI